MLFDLDLITYKGLYKTIKTEKINFNSKDGNRTILSNHIPIIIPVEMGTIETLENNKLSHYATNEGILFFENNKAKLICDDIIDINDVDIDFYSKKVEEEKKILSTSKKETDIKTANIRILRSMNKINAAKNRKS